MEPILTHGAGRRMLRPASSAMLAALLAGCAVVPDTTAPVRPAASPPASTPAPTRAPHERAPFRRAMPLMAPGLEGVIGARAEQLFRLFGPPRLDIVEGDARKLQFFGAACVLDAYLYPPGPGREPATTYVDARLSDGRDIDRAGCIAALRQR